MVTLAHIGRLELQYGLNIVGFTCEKWHKLFFKKKKKKVESQLHAAGQSHCEVGGSVGFGKSPKWTGLRRRPPKQFYWSVRPPLEVNHVDCAASEIASQSKVAGKIETSVL